MDLDDVRIFTTVVTAGSFTRAATQLGLPKSTVSRRVGELEDRLGVLLLQRTTRKLSLTDAGELYFARTRHAVEALEDAERALEEMHSEPRGTLRVTIPGDMSASFADLVGAFQLLYPRVGVIVFASGRRVDLAAEGFDLAIRAGKLDDSSLVSRRLLRSKLALFASPAYLTQHGTPTTPTDLTNHSCLIFSHERTDATWRLHGPQGVEEVPVQGRLASQDFTLLRAAAIDGQGIAFMPDMAGAAERPSGRLVRVLCHYASEEMNVHAVYPSARHLTPKVRVFINFCAEWMKTRIELASA